MNRIYVEKKEGYNLEAIDILNEVRSFLKIDSLIRVRVLTRYDAEGMTDQEFGQAVQSIFSQEETEYVYDSDYEMDTRFLAVESLPGQYDQRSDFATQCAKLVAKGQNVIVKCSKVILFYGDVTEEQFKTIKGYLINPVETVEAALDMPKTLKTDYQEIDKVETLSGFCKLDKQGLSALAKKYGINMDMEDLLYCQDYFKEEKKEPTITELRIFDTYWSDHCRHSTFMTIIDSVKIEDSLYKPAIEEAVARYYKFKEQTAPDSPVCLMDIAVTGMKKMRRNGMLSDMEVSEEVNACSIHAEVTVDGKPEEWLFMFKNETHNHPTEIEPFGGASTCLGGGIRDPLSGRAYVHGAIRLTGSGDPRTAFKDTLLGKLPQRKITKTAAEGYSSYSNQIGLASGHLSEIYDEGFRAKRMECGALVAGVKKSDVVRMSPEKGDVIVLVGGNTGRDGCGGATGSSKEHDESSLEKGGAEVQKGNPAIERNIVRLFRYPTAAKMIKKCNDFGAGGVSVAVCEMADSLVIDLDMVPLKYGGLDGTEIAISESQERMACLLASEDLDEFIAMADKENLQCVKVADVTDDDRMVMWWKGNKIVDLSARMLNSGGVRKHTNIEVNAPAIEKLNILASGIKKENNIRENWLANLSDLNVCSKASIASRFDTTSSAGTVIMPYGGKYQKTAEQGLCMKFPARFGKCDTATLMTLGYNPKFGYFSPFHQAVYAVLESVQKVCAMGGDPSKVRLTFQEYYEKLGTDPARWGKPYAALMGAFLAQDELGVPAIGGKDSMSGTFTDIDVPPSLISFAVSTADVKDVVSASLKEAGSRVVLVYADKHEDYMPDWDQVRSNLKFVHEQIRAGAVKSASTVGFGGVAATVSNMCFGNRTGFEFDKGVADLDIFTPDYTAFVLEIKDNADLTGLTYRELGTTTDMQVIRTGQEVITLDDALAAWEGTLEEVFPSRPLISALADKADASGETQTFSYTNEKTLIPKADFYGKCEAAPKFRKKSVVKVVILVFPGSNGEYELEDGFIRAGGNVNCIVFRNRTVRQQEESILALAEAIKAADILAIPSGMSAGCEPAGGAKMIAAILSKEPVRKAVEELTGERNGLILGVGEGFQALVRVGLLPYGTFKDSVKREEARPIVAVERNIMNQYMCQMVNVRLSGIKSPWLKNAKVGSVVKLPLSVQEGRIVMNPEMFEKLRQNGQITGQYTDENGNPSMEVAYNPCGADFAVESMTSPNGRILGMMTSFDRLGDDLYRNIPGAGVFDLLQSGIEYFESVQNPAVAIIMGSDSDLKVVNPAAKLLEKFGVPYEIRIMSAHRTPGVVSEYVKGLSPRGVKVLIAAAGKAAHLAGVAAAYTALPVIGLPISGATLDGMDALLSMVQMPPGIPVATVSVDGAENAALTAIAILGAADKSIQADLLKYRRDMAAKVAAKDRQLQEKRREVRE